MGLLEDHLIPGLGEINSFNTGKMLNPHYVPGVGGGGGGTGVSNWLVYYRASVWVPAIVNFIALFFMKSTIFQ